VPYVVQFSGARVRMVHKRTQNGVRLAPRHDSIAQRTESGSSLDRPSPCIYLS
jgi:hypothetical protein